jgi:hypothetical protein
MTSQKNFNFPGTTQIAKKPQKATKSHKKPQNATKRHKTPQNATKGHKTPQNATKRHKTPQKATKRHKRPQKATKRQTPQTSQKHFEPQRHNHGERYNIQPHHKTSIHRLHRPRSAAGLIVDDRPSRPQSIHHRELT